MDKGQNHWGVHDREPSEFRGRRWTIATRSFDLSTDDLIGGVLNSMASAIANGTFKMRAIVWAINVLPDPVGPISKIFDFCNSTSDDFLPFSALIRL